MTHAVDDGLENVTWFGPFAAELKPGGEVEYIIDARYEHHEALERFFGAVIDELEPLCSEGTSELNDHARRRDEC